MKKITWLLFIIYFGIFVAFGVFFYFKYSDKFLKSGASPVKKETGSASGKIYYSLENNLYRLSPDLKLDPANPERTERIQSTGEVGSLDVKKGGLEFAYEAKNKDGLSEIWLVNTASNQSIKIADQSKRELQDFKNFARPLFSHDGKLAFLAQSEKLEAVFTFELKKSEIVKVTDKFIAQIADYSWSQDSQKIIFCTKNQHLDGCYRVDISSKADQKIIEGEVLKISALQTDTIIYLQKEGETANLFRLDPATLKPERLTDIQAPKKIVAYQVSNSGAKIVYETLESTFHDIYVSEISGANKIQLTIDGKSSQPFFNANEDKIAFFRLNEGIFTLTLEGKTVEKIANLEVLIKLLLWR